MSDQYTVDISSDVIRGVHNLGSRSLVKNMSFKTIKSFIQDYIDKFGKPKIIMGALIWTNDVGDNYMISVYKNEEAFEIKDLSGILQE